MTKSSRSVWLLIALPAVVVLVGVLGVRLRPYSVATCRGSRVDLRGAVPVCAHLTQAWPRGTGLWDAHLSAADLSEPEMGKRHPAKLTDDRYRIADLGTLGGRSSIALGINNLGQVVGAADTGDGAEHAFLWRNGRLLDLGTLGGRNSRAVNINDKGQVVGEADTRDGRHAFLWSSGKTHDLGTFGGKESAAYAINNAGIVVGTAQRRDAGERAFLYRNGKKWPFKPLRSAVVSVHGINNRGQIVGDSFSGTYQIFIYSRRRAVTIGRYAYGARAVAINDRGDVIGNTDELEATIATLWRNGKTIHLGYFCVALGINNRGQIVGYQGSDPAVPGPPDRAVIWENFNIRRLDELLAEGADWHLQTAFAINDRGQIVGVGTYQGKERAFLLTPAPVKTSTPAPRRLRPGEARGGESAVSRCRRP